MEITATLSNYGAVFQVMSRPEWKVHHVLIPANMKNIPSV